MKILSIDTASDICGVSILENMNLIYNSDKRTGRTHSENLLPMIKSAFDIADLILKDIDLIVCDIGPGSFTGIRIGVSTVKGFSDSLNIQCIGVSSLEGLAYNIKNSGYICSIIDSKNDNCYFALYRLENGVYTEVISPTSSTIDDCLKNLIPFADNLCFVGDGSTVYKEKIVSSYFSNSTFTEDILNDLNSFNLGLAGYQKFKKHDFSEVLPLYLKNPQAQIQLEEKLKNI